MKSLIFLLVLSFLLIFLVNPVSAGISIGSGGITIPAGETKEICDVWIYATQDGGIYNVETTGDIGPLTAAISPNGFTLESIDCPQETLARRACITQQCLSGDGSSCKVICVKFTAPMLIEWEPKKVVYDGAILNNIKISAAVIKEPYTFSVHVQPMDMKPIVGLVAVVIVIVIFVLTFAKKKSKKR